MKGWKTALVILVILGVLAIFAARNMHELRQALDLARSAEMWPLLLAIAMQCVYYVFAGLVVRECLALVDFDAPFWWTVQATFLLIFVSRIVPGPAATGPATMYYLLERRGLSKARSALVGPLFYAVDYGVFFVVLGAGLLSLALRHEMTRAVEAALPLVAVFVAVTLFLIALFHDPARLEKILAHASGTLNRGFTLVHLPWRMSERAPSQVAQTVREMSDRLAEHPRIGWKLVGSGAAMLLCDVATMAAVFRAFGVWLPLPTAFLGFCLATVGAIVSVLPGGLGTFEAAMVLGFVGLGVPKPPTLAATLTYRVIATWIPALLGVFAYRAFLAHRQDVPGNGSTD